MAEIEKEVDRLFELPLEEFIAARDELARSLRADGNAIAADEVKQLSKPNTAAWTVNQLSRRRNDSMTVLLDAATKLSKAQERALSGREPGDALRQAQAEERQAIRELTRQAQEILEDAGRSASSSLLNQVSSTLRAAAVSEGGRAALELGRLSGEVKSSGFDALGGLKVPDATTNQSARGHDELAERRRQREEEKRKRGELKERARKLAAVAKDKERIAEHAEKAGTDARRAAEESRREAEEAAADLQNLEQ